MKEIKLSNSDKVILVDDCDYDIVNQYNWHIHHKYVQRAKIINGKQKSIMLHRSIYEYHYGKIPEGMVVDHIDRNTLNNSLSNLRLATPQENARNHGMQKNNTSGYKGVYFESYIDKRRNNKRYKFWTAYWKENGKVKVKRFPPTEEGKIQAAKYRDKKVKEIYAEFCGTLNFPDEK